ncbi:MAG: hypothetical protein ABH822_02430 [Patescibacteria group bacterium]
MSGKTIAVAITALTILLVGALALENYSGGINTWLSNLQIASVESDRSRIQVRDDNSVDSRFRGNDMREVVVYQNNWSAKIVIPPYHYAHIIPPRNGWVGLLPEGSSEEITWRYGETPYLGNISAFQLRGTDGGIARIWIETNHQKQPRY